VQNGIRFGVKMPYDRSKRLAVALLSLIGSALVFGGGYELFESWRDDRWRADYQENGNWYGTMTVPSDNKTMMWEYRPNCSFEKLHTNRFGFRDEDFQTTAKPEGTYRLAFVGDSVTLGLRVEYEEIFVRRFDAWLRQEPLAMDVQALNFGVDGYNTLQVEALLGERVLDFQPDKVVYVMCLNDFDFDDASGDKIKYFRKPDGFLRPRIERLLKRNLLGQSYYQFHFDKHRDEVFASISAMKQWLDQRGVDFQVVLLPVFPKRRPSFDDYPYAAIHEEIMAFFDHDEIPAIDLLGDFQASNRPPWDYSFDQWHPSPLGHEFIAERLRMIVDQSAAAPRP
jgi:lysophospholipase L1-like esterase